MQTVVLHKPPSSLLDSSLMPMSANERKDPRVRPRRGDDYAYVFIPCCCRHRCSLRVLLSAL